MEPHEARFALNGDPLLSNSEEEARTGFARALTRDGYEVVRGIDEHLDRASGTITRRFGQFRETWAREASNGRYSLVSRVPINLPQGDPWLVAGRAFDLRDRARADALARLRAVPTQHRTTAAILWLHGVPGSGKSEMLACLANALRQHGVRFESMRFGDIKAEVERSGWGAARAGLDDLQRRLDTADVVIVDDVGTSRPHGQVEQALLDLSDHRYEARRTTIWACNVRAAELQRHGWDGRLVSRWSAATMLCAGTTDYRRAG